MNDPTTPTGTGGADTGPADPVLARRAQVDRLASVARRTGYLGFAAALVVFFVGLGVGLDGTLVAVILVCLAVGSVFLLPGILLGYAVKAARREEVEDRARRTAGRAGDGPSGGRP